MTTSAPAAPLARFSLGITGHRPDNAAFAANGDAVVGALSAIFARIDELTVKQGAHRGAIAPTRLHSLLADGVDQIAMAQGKARGWELVAPLPFGRDLNIAINAHPGDAADAQALLAGGDATDHATQAHADALRYWSGASRLFELADRDEAIAQLFLARLRSPQDISAAQAYSFAASERVALAAHVMIEQSDLIIGIWDGASTSFIGGTGATIALALEMGTPVLWIDARAPDGWRLLLAPEALAGLMADAPVDATRDATLASLVREALGSRDEGSSAHGGHGGSGGFASGAAALGEAHWRPRSPRLWHAYRRIEALFGGEGLKSRFRKLSLTYETPDAILTGSAAGQLGMIETLPGQNPDFVARIKADVLRRFAWADGISARLSDTYRGGMILNFLFSAFAIVGGIAYLPFSTPHEKWMFASFELGLLLAIMIITIVGQKRRWHGRWFETRRAAEYLRHAPILLALGVARPAGRWPKGTRTNWPELYARHTIRGVGLPALTVTRDYLRGALAGLLAPYVIAQRDYHRLKARRLSRAHHNLDKLSEYLFILAIISVTGYLALKLGGHFHVLAEDVAGRLSLLLTFLGVLLPTFGAAIAGIRYFGDFERFSAISEVTAEQLDAVASRIALLAAAPEGAIDYARVADLAHATDDIVVDEIESWQAVFAGKHITVPV